MANTTIKIKRSFANSVPSILGEGELAYSYLSNTLFIGSSTNVPISIALANVNGRILAVEANSSIATLAYNRANQAYDLADTARSESYYANVAAYSAITQAQIASSTVRVSENGTGSLSDKQLNFVDSPTANFSVTDAFNGNANIGVAVAANLGITSLSTDYVSFTQLPYTLGPSYNEGRMWYNQNAHSIQFQTDFPAFDAVPGQIEYIRVYNNTGVQINKGKPVYITGVKGSANPVDSRILSIALADASDGLKKDVIGLTGHDIPNGSEGFVLSRGPLFGIDTSSLVAGERFHLGATAGSIVAYAPEYPNWPMDLGECLTSNPVFGSIYVDIIDHSFERMRVLYDAYVGGSLVVDGDLTVFGTQNFVSASDLYVGGQFLYLDGADSINVDSTIFTGPGLNDMSFKGNYSGDAASKSFYVRIASQGIPGFSVDTFDWSYNNSFSPLQGIAVPITGSNQLLSDGIYVKFVALTGHTPGSQWSGTAYATNRDFGVIGHYNDGTYKHAGLFRDSADNEFKFFTRYVPEPEGNIDTSNSTFQLGNVRVEKISANSFFAGSVNLLSAINSAANATAVYANNTLRIANAGINFVNSSTIRATVSSGSGLANISFDLIGSSGIASFPVTSGSFSLSANGLNFVNSATVGVTVTQGVTGNANISFTTLAGGGTVTSVGTGIGLSGGPITTSGTISANIASTTVQGVTKLVDLVTSNDSANAATANSVKITYDLASAAHNQANLAYTQANTSNSLAVASYRQANFAFTQANTGYTQANLAYTQANTANLNSISAYGQANLAFSQANTANSIAISAYGQANAAFAQANTANNNANAAYTQANLANSIAISAFGQANLAFTAANNAANTVRITANSGSAQSAVSLNFVNTSTVTVSISSVPGSGIANIAFNSTATSTGGGTANLIVSDTPPASPTANSTLWWQSNTGSLKIYYSDGDSSQWVDAFIPVTPIGNVTSVGTGIGLSGGPITTSGTISANIANTTIQGVTKLIDVVNSNDTGNAATANSVKAAYDQAIIGLNTVSVSANGTTISSGKRLNFINTATVVVSVIDSLDGNANISFSSTATGGSFSGTVNNINVTNSLLITNVASVVANSSSFFTGGGSNKSIFTANAPIKDIITAGYYSTSSRLDDPGFDFTSYSNGAKLLYHYGAFQNTTFNSANNDLTTQYGFWAGDLTGGEFKNTPFPGNTTNYAFFTNINNRGPAGPTGYAVYTSGNASSVFSGPVIIQGANAIASATVYANGGSVQHAKSLNFVNTASINVSVSSGSTGNANIAFSYNPNGLYTIWVPATSMFARSSNGATATWTESSTNKINSRTFDFSNTSQNFVQFCIRMPKAWDRGTIQYEPSWTAFSGSGSVSWNVAAVAFSDNDWLDGTPMGTPRTSTDNLLNFNYLHVGPQPATPITVAGSPQAGDVVWFEVSRDVSGTTIAANTKLIGITLFINVNAKDDT